jgi:CheY-like chemotaxis protein
MVKQHLDKSYYLRFDKEEEASSYMINAIRENEPPNLLITDFAHPGLNGYEFAKKIRTEERKWKRKPIPVLLLTMYPREKMLIKMGLSIRIFNFYLQKNAQTEDILGVFKSVL